MSEQEPNIEQKTKEQQKQIKRSRKFLSLYIIGLFSVALVLIILSYLTQVRANDLNSQLGEQITVAQGAQERVEQLQKTNTDQSNKIKELEAEVERLTPIEDENEILNALVTLQNAYYANDMANTALLLEQFEAKYLEELDENLKVIYDVIKTGFTEKIAQTEENSEQTTQDTSEE